LGNEGGIIVLRCSKTFYGYRAKIRYAEDGKEFDEVDEEGAVFKVRKYQC